MNILNIAWKISVDRNINYCPLIVFSCWKMSESGDADDEINIDEFNQTVYVPPAQKSVQEILEADNSDESLQRCFSREKLHTSYFWCFRYKQKLLEGNTQGVVVVFPDNPLNVIVKKLSLIVDGNVVRSVDLPGVIFIFFIRPSNSILPLKSFLPATEEFTLSLKEGCHYKIQLEFYVQREIVTGLKYLHKVSRLGVGGKLVYKWFINVFKILNYSHERVVHAGLLWAEERRLCLQLSSWGSSFWYV